MAIVNAPYNNDNYGVSGLAPQNLSASVQRVDINWNDYAVTPGFEFLDDITVDVDLNRIASPLDVIRSVVIYNFKDPSVFSTAMPMQVLFPDTRFNIVSGFDSFAFVTQDHVIFSPVFTSGVKCEIRRAAFILKSTIFFSNIFSFNARLVLI